MLRGGGGGGGSGTGLAAADAPTTTTTTTAATALPTASLTPSEVRVVSTTTDAAKLRVMLPPMSAAAGGPIDVRVLVRPAKHFREFSGQRAALYAKESNMRMKHNMATGQRMLKAAQNKEAVRPDVMGEDFREFNNQLREVQTEQDKIHETYAKQCAYLVPKPASAAADPDVNKFPPQSDWFAAVSGGFIALSKADLQSPLHTTATATTESLVVDLARLGSNAFYEVCVQARRNTDAPTSPAGDDGGAPQVEWSPMSLSTSFTTLPATWQSLLEGAGLRTLIEPFRENGLADLATWLPVLDSADRKMELGIDPAGEGQLRAILSREGIVSAEERERLDRERDELVQVATRLVVGIREANAKEKSFELGDAVTDRKTGKRFGVVAEPASGGGSTVAVRWVDGGDPASAPITRNVAVKDLAASKFDIFLSHAQQEAQNQVAHLSVLLREVGATSWLDMDSERLEARDMARGISNSSTFLLYLTRSYFSRYFCRLESSVARALRKKLIVVYEPDERHGGMGDYVALVDAATRKYPEFREMLMSVEAIPMARRAYQRRAVVDEIVKRAEITPTLVVAGGGSTASGGRGSTLGLVSGSSSTAAGLGASVEAELRRLIVDMQMEITDLKSEVAALKAQVGGRAD